MTSLAYKDADVGFLCFVSLVKLESLEGKYVFLCGLEPKRRLDSFHVFLSMPCFFCLNLYFPLVLKNDYSVMMSLNVQYHYLFKK